VALPPPPQDTGDATCSDGSAPAEVKDGQARIKPWLDEVQLARALEGVKQFKVLSRPRPRTQSQPALPQRARVHRPQGPEPAAGPALPSSRSWLRPRPFLGPSCRPASPARPRPPHAAQLVKVRGIQDLFAGFSDAIKARQFERRAQHMGSIWCCALPANGKPGGGTGHIWCAAALKIRPPRHASGPRPSDGVCICI
jgi:hypothetical protein